MLRVSSQLFALGAILPTFHLDTSNDRPASANSGAVVQTLPVWTLALVEAVLVAGFAVLLFTSGLALVLAQL